MMLEQMGTITTVEANVIFRLHNKASLEELYGEGLFSYLHKLVVAKKLT